VITTGGIKNVKIVVMIRAEVTITDVGDVVGVYVEISVNEH
jgi:hypothetical protein